MHDNENIIKTADFVKGVVGTDALLTEDLPQIAFAGRSNVGKSSALNTILGRNSLAKSSSTPGKTSELNFFIVNRCVYFVDLPGYGYAKVKPQLGEKFRKRIIWYLTESGARPEYVVLVIDAFVGITDYDRDLLDIITKEHYQVVLLASKIDKLNQKERSLALRTLTADVAFYGVAPEDIIPFSSHTKEGREKVLALFAELLREDK